jgi:pimeloyl-ACP methyl ester carboxylesterase
VIGALRLSAIILLVPALCLAQGRAGDLRIEPYAFQPSTKDETVPAEVGRLLVPENRRNPQSRLIEVVFVRFKSSSPNPGSPIFYLAGGPGGSGIGAARSTRFPLFMAMRAFGDVIALDQRGEGDSTPNTFCRETYSLPLEQAPDRAAVVQVARERSRSCVAYWQGQGCDLTGYNTNESADDLEALRVALGAKKISLWGISYGTHLALATIKKHEQSIDRVILAGVEGLDDTLKSPAAVQRHLEDIDRLVRADPALRVEIPDFLGLMRTVLERLDREPATVRATDPKSRQDRTVVINRYVMQLLTASAVGTDSLLAFPRLYYAASKGDFSEIAQQWVALSNSGIGFAMAFMMDCSSGASGERRRQIARESDGTLLGSAADGVFPDVCDAWGDPDLGEGFRVPVRSNVPALFISGTLDGRTPVGGAEAVRQGFPNSSHLVIEGAWHGDPLFLSSPRIEDVMGEFMRGVPVSATAIALPPPAFVPLKRDESGRGKRDGAGVTDIN